MSVVSVQLENYCPLPFLLLCPEDSGGLLSTLCWGAYDTLHVRPGLVLYYDNYTSGNSLSCRNPLSSRRNLLAQSVISYICKLGIQLYVNVNISHI